MITSPHNDKLKLIRRLRNRRDRDKLGLFVAEGEDLSAAAAHSGWPTVECLVAEGCELPGTQVEPELLAQASELGSSTRALGIFETRWAPAPAGPLCVYLHGVGDPGNVGTILRSAEAFGASCVVLGPGSADPYGPKAVRASMGAIFTVPVARATPAQLPRPLLALDVGGAPLREMPAAATLMVGAEREGLPAELLAEADHVAAIPIANHSLNAAMAATVALYELTRRMPPA